MIDTLGRVLVFFAFIGLGVVLVRFKRLNAQGLDGLGAYFYWIGFPAWLVVSFSQLHPFGLEMGRNLLAYLAAMLTTAVLVVIAARLFKVAKPDSIGAGMASFINNSAFLGIPIALSLFGAEAGRTGPLIVAADFLVLFGIGCAALAKASGHTFREALQHTARNPTVIAAVTGVVLMGFGIHFPAPVEGALEILGKSGPPVALVALGGMLGLMDPRTLLRIDPANAIAMIGKTIVAPLLVAGVLSLMHVDPTVVRIFVFLSATPTAVSVFIQTKMYGTWFEGAAKTVAQGTVLSLFTLSILALILKG